MTDQATPTRAPHRLSPPDIRSRKGGAKLAMLSLYDHPFAQIAQKAGIDLVLVGDTLGMVVLGHDSTVPVRLEDVIYHARAVRRGAPATHVIADMPFLTYHIDTPRTIENAGRLIQEGEADSVKLEGGQEIAERVAALVRAGIPVMGHIGLTPQSAGALGGFKVQGRDLATARKILADAQAIEAAGAFAIVVEAVPSELARLITARVAVPTIGIGAGPHCDGQVLVAHDLLGLEDRVSARFAKRFANLSEETERAFAAYAHEVRGGNFPGPEHSYGMSDDVLDQLRSDDNA